MILWLLRHCCPPSKIGHALRPARYRRYDRRIAPKVRRDPDEKPTRPTRERTCDRGITKNRKAKKRERRQRSATRRIDFATGVSDIPAQLLPLFGRQALLPRILPTVIALIVIGRWLVRRLTLELAIRRRRGRVPAHIARTEGTRDRRCRRQRNRQSDRQATDPKPKTQRHRTHRNIRSNSKSRPTLRAATRPLPLDRSRPERALCHRHAGDKRSIRVPFCTPSPNHGISIDARAPQCTEISPASPGPAPIGPSCKKMYRTMSTVFPPRRAARAGDGAKADRARHNGSPRAKH